MRKRKEMNKGIMVLHFKTVQKQTEKNKNKNKGKIRSKNQEICSV